MVSTLSSNCDGFPASLQVIRQGTLASIFWHNLLICCYMLYFYIHVCDRWPIFLFISYIFILYLLLFIFIHFISTVVDNEVISFTQLSAFYISCMKQHGKNARGEVSKSRLL